jgi:sugar lactone lactonase YvrE
MKPTNATATVCALLLALSGIGWPRVAAAIDLAPGDIVISDTNLDVLFRVDPKTGDRAILSSVEVGTGAKFVFPLEIQFPSDGSVLVSDINLEAIVRVDPATGNRSFATGRGVGSGPKVRGVRTFELDRDGTLLVADSVPDTLLRVNPTTGDRQVISGSGIGSGPETQNVVGLALLPDNQLLAADSQLDAIVRIDLATGNRTIVSSNEVGSGPRYVDPFDVIVASDGSALVINSVPIIKRGNRRPGVLRVDLASGDRTLFSGANAGAGFEMRTATSIAIEADGSLLVIDAGLDRLFRIDPVTGDRVVISSSEVGEGPMFYTPRRLAVVPGTPELDGGSEWIPLVVAIGAIVAFFSLLASRRRNS